jgi:hypothetical protein
MSIAPIDNKLLPLGSLSPPLDERALAPEQPEHALETQSGASSSAPLSPADAQSLLARDFWPTGSPRQFDLAALTSAAAAEPPNGDELERIATEVTSYLS